MSNYQLKYQESPGGYQFTAENQEDTGALKLVLG